MCGLFLCSYNLFQMISIIIPVFNEEEYIGPLVSYLLLQGNGMVKEVMVIDGGSTDDTTGIADRTGAKVIKSPEAGRAFQMNYGAAYSSSDILYFIHADTFPPPGFANDIIQAVNKGFNCGRYRTMFDSNKWILKVNAFFTRFDWFICHGGDQTFFITKELFNSIRGFDPAMKIMEEYELTVRAKQKGRYKIFNRNALVSARKYQNRSWWQVQMANRKAVALYKKGASQTEILNTYREMLKR